MCWIPGGQHLTSKTHHNLSHPKPFLLNFDFRSWRIWRRRLQHLEVWLSHAAVCVPCGAVMCWGWESFSLVYHLLIKVFQKKNVGSMIFTLAWPCSAAPSPYPLGFHAGGRKVPFGGGLSKFQLSQNGAPLWSQEGSIDQTAVAHLLEFQEPSAFPFPFPFPLKEYGLLHCPYCRGARLHQSPSSGMFSAIALNWMRLGH